MSQSTRANVESGIFDVYEEFDSILVFIDPATKTPFEEGNIAYKSKTMITFSGPKWKTERWHVNTQKEPTGRHHITIFDGSKTIDYEEDLNNPLRKVAEIRTGETVLFNEPYYGFRQKKHFESLKNFQFEQILLDGHPYIVVKAESRFQDSRFNKKGEYILDPDKGFCCLEVKISKINDGRLTYWDKSEGFAEITKGFWYPNTYTMKEFMPDFKTGENKVKTYLKVDLISGKINVPVPESTFQIEFPPDTQVIDGVINEHYIVPGGALEK